jgi:hypothetical protein
VWADRHVVAGVGARVLHEHRARRRVLRRLVLEVPVARSRFGGHWARIDHTDRRVARVIVILAEIAVTPQAVAYSAASSFRYLMSRPLLDQKFLEIDLRVRVSSQGSS